MLRDCNFTSFTIAVSVDDAIAAAAERAPELITADVELSPGVRNRRSADYLFGTRVAVIFTGRCNEVRQ
jgi:hypothetical protein